MRRMVATAMIASLALLGGKCDKPKKPKEQAADAAALAWVDADVAAGLEQAPEVVVHVDSVGERSARVRFTREGEEIVAAVVTESDHFLFRITPDGEVLDRDEAHE